MQVKVKISEFSPLLLLSLPETDWVPRVPYISKAHLVSVAFWYLESLCTSKIHFPVGFSPQKCVDIKGQSLNPELERSLLRESNKVDRVPCGEVK